MWDKLQRFILLQYMFQELKHCVSWSEIRRVRALKLLSRAIKRRSIMEQKRKIQLNPGWTLRWGRSEDTMLLHHLKKLNNDFTGRSD